jgi:biopolymer transport protein ExbD
MAGGGDIGGQEGGKKHKKGKKKKKARRVGIRIDMTPLVDIAFLLLTFFMFSTSMSRPQTMEINLPPQDVKVEIAESNLLTLRVDKEGVIYWSMGIESPQKLDFSGLRNLLIEKSSF